MLDGVRAAAGKVAEIPTRPSPLFPLPLPPLASPCSHWLPPCFILFSPCFPTHSLLSPLFTASFLISLFTKLSKLKVIWVLTSKISPKIKIFPQQSFTLHPPNPNQSSQNINRRFPFHKSFPFNFRHSSNGLRLFKILYFHLSVFPRFLPFMSFFKCV